MNRILICCTIFLLFLLSGNKLAAQDSSRSILSENNIGNFYGAKVAGNYSSSLSSRFNHWEIFKISSSAIRAKLAASRGKRLTVGLQLSERLAFNITLETSDLLADNFILTTQTAQGKLTTRPPPLDYFYKGHVNDTGGGDVRLCIKEGFIYGYIRKAEKEYFIEPVSRYYTTANKDEFLFYEAKDVIGKAISCGYNDVQTATKNVINTASQNQRPFSPDSVAAPVCKKLRFRIVADYSMYLAFNKDIDAMQTFLFANQNMAEGLFNTLNFDSTKAGDVGSDLIKFEVIQIHVSTCDSCDFTGSIIQINDIFKAFANWGENNLADEGYSIVNELYSMRDLLFGINSNIGGASAGSLDKGCVKNFNMILIKYFNQDALTLRMQVAHETGHQFGCRHDNEIKPSVNGFIMNTSGTLSPTGRFSRLPDFGGVNYSSQQVINNTVIHSTCLGDCSPPVCDTVTGLKIGYYKSSDSVKITWEGVGSYLVKYKIQDAPDFDSANELTVTGNEAILKNIVSCSNYIIQLQKICSPGKLGMASSITSTSSEFSVKELPTNIRGDRYDLNLQLNCSNCLEKNVNIKLDQLDYNFYITKFPSNVFIPDLFADGATHRIDYNGDGINNGCKLQNLYKAPYYRENSISIINENFDGCQLPDNWKDTVFRLFPDYPTPWKWGAAKYYRNLSTIDQIYFYSGNFDNSCMLFNYNGFGREGLVLPAKNITKYKSVYLSFDYKFIMYNSVPLNNLKAVFKVQVFDGTRWEDILEQNEIDIRVAGQRHIWDTIAPRMFINMDKYINEQFQIRFVIDDGSQVNTTTGNYERALTFLFLDNLKLDGYEKSEDTSAYSYSVFPNPATENMLLKFSGAPTGNINYTIIDACGRLLKADKLNFYRIDISKLSRGLYFITVFENNKQIGKSQKIIKL